MYPHVLVVAFVEASLGVLFGPAESAAVRSVVAPEQIKDAVARNQSRAAIPGVLGPPLGGVLLTVNRALPFVADAISYLVSLVCVLVARTPARAERGSVADRHPLRSVFDGLRWVWSRPFLRALLLWFVGAGLVFNSIGLTMLVLARDRGASSAQLGVMFAITSAGGVTGALAAPVLTRRLQARSIVLGFAWIAVAATCLLAVAHSPYVIGALGAAAFLLSPSLSAVAFATVAEQAPDAMQGRATSAAIQLGNLGAPVGPVLAGTLLAWVGPVRAVVTYACALFVLAVIASLSRGLKHAA